MTTFLYSLPLTAGADKMLETDPHGWTLTIISVSVVFTALIILYFLYSISGGIFSGKFKAAAKTPKKVTIDQETAAAIALALQAEFSSDDEAAIAMALHLYLSEAVHDLEPGFITIAPTSVHQSSAWANKSLTFRRTPR